MSFTMIWLFKSFAELSVVDLYAILKAREAVFSQEQRCTDPDLDDQDQTAWHLFCLPENQVMAYTRLFEKDGYVSMGRLLVDRASRGRGLGHDLMRRALDIIDSNFLHKKLVISAQAYLAPFYQGYGFTTISDPYEEAGITHIRMEK